MSPHSGRRTALIPCIWFCRPLCGLVIELRAVPPGSAKLHPGLHAVARCAGSHMTLPKYWSQHLVPSLNHTRRVPGSNLRNLKFASLPFMLRTSSL
jgi:hypothetical protein